MNTLIKFAAIAAAATIVSLPTTAAAQSGHTAVGAERRAILDALRGPVQRQVGPAEFVVQEIRVHGGWAFVQATPQRPGGRPIPTGRIPNYEADSGADVSAILRQNGNRWQVVRHVIGAGDVWYCGMGPRGLVPRCNGGY